MVRFEQPGLRQFATYATVLAMTGLLTIDGAAYLLCLSPAAIRRLVRKRAIPFIDLPVLNGDQRFDRDALLEWAAQHARPAVDVETREPVMDLVRGGRPRRARRMTADAPAEK